MAFLAAFVVPVLLAAPVAADTIFDAMAKAYDNNPDLNAARAGLRATDEGVTIAKAGWRPQISAFAQNTQTWYDNSGATFQIEPPSLENPAGVVTDRIKATTHQRGLTITQQIFDGFQTLNNVRAAESTVFSERASLRAREIQILLSAAEAYANIGRDQQIIVFRKQNIAFLREQVSAAKVRLDLGDGTTTDVSLAEADLARAQALVAAAISQLKQSEAVYVQIVGDAPKDVRQAKPVSKLLPKNIDTAVATGWREHPSILSTMHAIDAAGFQVKSAEGAMLPGVVVQGQIQSTEGTEGVNSLSNYNTSSITARLNVPLYQGGAEYGQIRQAKERLGQQRIMLDSARLEVQQTIVSAMAQYDAAIAIIDANNRQLKAANDALAGVIEERAAGQATQLDVLTAQAVVLNAKESLAVAHRDAVVASFSILASMGRLTVETQNLQVTEYKPEVHYNKVKDAWFGLRTVDGR
ncbi:TolC family outer membrane protein [Rhizobium sp. LjRoot254]|uniref:TolC family outer membrane protein n=1 Tax=Rhizobium sp. LjRoot254 TaxID=3342297 RepID=UPI003ECCC98E